MAAISFSISRGVTASGFKISDFTVGVAAPGTGDFEFRYNTTDTNGKNVTKEDLWIALEQIQRAIHQGGTQVNFTNAPPL